MKLTFVLLVLSVVVVFAQAFPTKPESKETKVQQYAAVLKANRAIQAGSPEFQEIYNKFDDTITDIDRVLFRLYTIGFAFLALVNSFIEQEFGEIVMLNLNKIESNLLYVLLALPPNGSIEDVATLSKKSWDVARLHFKSLIEEVDKLVENKAGNYFSQFQDFTGLMTTEFNDALVGIDEVLAKYLPKN